MKLIFNRCVHCAIILGLKCLLIPEHLGFYQSHSNFIKLMSSENGKMMRNLALFLSKPFQLFIKSDKWCWSLSRTSGQGIWGWWWLSGVGGAGTDEAFSGGALWCSWRFGWCARDFVVFGVRWSACGLFSLEALVFCGGTLLSHIL